MKATTKCLTTVLLTLFLMIEVKAQDGRLQYFKHYARKGETLKSIGDIYGKTQDYLAALNNLPTYSKLEVGQIILIRLLEDGEFQDEPENYRAPSPQDNTSIYQLNTPPSKSTNYESTKTVKEAAVTIGPGGVVYDVSDDGYHTVEPGQTLYRISLIYKISVDDLKALNNLKSNEIVVGSRIKVRK